MPLAYPLHFLPLIRTYKGILYNQCAGQNSFVMNFTQNSRIFSQKSSYVHLPPSRRTEQHLKIYTHIQDYAIS